MAETESPATAPGVALPPPSLESYDVLIVGGGLAGLGTALRLADRMNVAIVAKAALTESSSLYAQGGIAAVRDSRADSFESHIADTLGAGGGLCHRDAVEVVVRGAPAAVNWLVDQGVAFDSREGARSGPSRPSRGITPSLEGRGGATPGDGRDAGGKATPGAVAGAVADSHGPEHTDTALHLTREGGHSHRRVVHAADATGRAVQTTLEAKVRRHPNIRLYEHHLAIDLITAAKLGRAAADRCLGLYALDKASGQVRTLAARFTVLATGGASKVYLYTSNPDTSTGDGIAMAWRAGCRVANMEFVQFHPTCLWHPRAKSFLISEAVRGEGGRLLLPNGEPFMHAHDARGELAPRDVVARAIDYEMKRRGLDHVMLDISHKPAAFIREHFPTIYQRCRELGYDLAREPIPVVPAAHYTCGGVVTDLAARTDLDGLYAVGECSFTGLHGANRLASNSLLECLVFGEAAAQDMLRRQPDAPPGNGTLPAWDETRVTDADEQVVVSHNWDELRRGMWDYVGIVRTTKRLERAQHRVDLLREEIREYYRNFKVTNDLIELRNLVLVAELIIRSAMARHESRGLHYTRDYPQKDAARPPYDTLLTPPGFQVAAVPVAT